MMKKLMNNSIALVSMITILFFACSKENPISEVENDSDPDPDPTEEPNNEIPGPTFDLLNSPVIEKVVDDQGNEMHRVSFEFSGEADKIDFWSGQSGNDYQYRDGRVVGYDALNLSFDLRKNANSQQNNFSVHVSTNFNGEYTFENVSGADWTDITEHFTIPTATNVWLSAGTHDIIAHKEEDKPLYVAFKYTYYPQPPAGTPSIWRINPFKLSAVSVLGEVEIGNQTNPDWKFVSDAIDNVDVSPARSRIEGTSQGRTSNIFLQYGNTINKEIGHETWCVSKAFELNSIDMGADQAITIKESVAPAITAYQHHYTEPGTYEVVFIARNIDGSGGKEVVKTVQVTIP